MKNIKIMLTIFLFPLTVTNGFGQNTSSPKEDVEIKNKNIKGGTYTSKTNIKASGKVKKGTKGVVFKAEEGITLSSGFSSEAGSDLIIKIGDVEEPKEVLAAKGDDLLKHSIVISPNPFKYETTVSFTLPQKAMTSISIYDEKDNIVKKLYQAETGKGNHELELSRNGLKAGIYTVVLKTADAILVKKLIVVQ